MGMIPRWLIVLIVVAAIFFVGNSLGLWHVHFSIGGSLGV